MGLPPKGQRCAAAEIVQAGELAAAVQGRRGVSVYSRVFGVIWRALWIVMAK